MIPQFIRADFASATRDVLYGMCIIMAVAAVIALRGLRRGVQEDTPADQAGLSDQLPGEDPGVGLDPARALGPAAIVQVPVRSVAAYFFQGRSTRSGMSKRIGAGTDFSI